MRYFDRSTRLRRRALREVVLVIIGSVLAVTALAVMEARFLYGALQAEASCPA